MPHYVVAYDISNDRSRRKVAELLLAVLGRVQYSVFEGETKPEALQAAVRQAIDYLDPETDSLRVYRLCGACIPRVDAYGRKPRVRKQVVTIL